MTSSLPSKSEVTPQSQFHIFVRDDDIGELTDEVRLFVEMFADHGVPVSYQVIPARFTPQCADYLLEKAEQHPSLIEIGQHGLRHEMLLGGKQLKREYGPEVSLADQTKSVQEGLDALKERLGGRVPVVVFTPPQHKFDRNTLQAVAVAGHKVFSAASYPTLHHQTAYQIGRWLGLSSVRHHGISHHGHRRPEVELCEISISVAVDDGRTIRCPAKGLARKIEKAREHTKQVGLMFHHAVYSGPTQRAELAAIVKQLTNYPLETFSKLSDLAAL